MLVGRLLSRGQPSSLYRVLFWQHSSVLTMTFVVYTIVESSKVGMNALFLSVRDIVSGPTNHRSIASPSHLAVEPSPRGNVLCVKGMRGPSTPHTT